MLDLAGRLFGIKFPPAPTSPVWHPEVEGYDVLRGRARCSGRIYLDMHPRDGKYKHAASSRSPPARPARSCRRARCVQLPAPGAEPALMEHGDVKTFFHEFGHLLHHVFGGHTPLGGPPGVATEWDFVEAPSQMLEEWVWDAATLATFARHDETGEPIPAELVAQRRRPTSTARACGCGSRCSTPPLSLELHRRDPADLDPAASSASCRSATRRSQHVDGHVSSPVVRPSRRLLGDLLHVHVVAGDREGPLHAPSAEGLLDRGPACALPRARARAGRLRARRRAGPRLPRPRLRFDAYEEWLDAS